MLQFSSAQPSRGEVIVILPPPRHCAVLLGKQTTSQYVIVFYGMHYLQLLQQSSRVDRGKVSSFLCARPLRTLTGTGGAGGGSYFFTALFLLHIVWTSRGCCCCCFLPCKSSFLGFVFAPIYQLSQSSDSHRANHGGRPAGGERDYVVYVLARLAFNA